MGHFSAETRQSQGQLSAEINSQHSESDQNVRVNPPRLTLGRNRSIIQKSTLPPLQPRISRDRNSVIDSDANTNLGPLAKALLEIGGIAD
jgi:hypothetical protein